MTLELSLHEQALMRFARFLSRGRPDLADDILQQTRLQAWRNKHRVDYSRSCKPWLMRIMKNEFLQLIRKANQQVELCEESLALENHSFPNLQTKFEFFDLMQSLSSLPPQQRQAIVLVLAQGFTYDEAARRLGSKAGTIKSRVARGRQTLIQIKHKQDAA